jgi:rSAM/selenodomain-associated transferase 1
MPPCAPPLNPEQRERLAVALDDIEKDLSTGRDARPGPHRCFIEGILWVMLPDAASAHSPNALGVFAKPPVPGRVKTRLIGRLTPRQAADLHYACVLDSIQLACLVREARCCFFAAPGAPQKATAEYPRWKPIGPRWRIGKQRGADLGARLANAFRDLFDEGAEKVVIIGTDSPWMGEKRILRAFRELDKRDVVLGPALDGGYYLVGMRQLLPQLFHGIDWGTSRVLRQTLEKLKRLALRPALLQPDFDLDRPADFRRLKKMWEKPRRFPSHLDLTFHGWKHDGVIRSRLR